ncbi:MAG: tripartite tricarboxylate transporter TctB family protein [Betaproteobacteria bacterium]
MRIKSQKDFVSGIILIVVGIAFALGAMNYSFGVAIRPGPGYFPFGLGIILALLGLIVFVTSFFRHCEDGDPIGSFPWRALTCVVGAIVFFGFFLPRLGFLIAFPTMIVITSAAGSEFCWKDALLNALALTVMSYLIFIFGLQLPIPVWPV